MRLRKQTWAVIKLGDVVSELRTTSNNPIVEGYSNYIGFEHIDSEYIYLKRHGFLSGGVSFRKTFKRGDILFGKIRAYLRKVAIAPFDGICSSDILVLRTKDHNRLDQTFLPYLLNTESFFKKAIDTSIGTTLPRTKWFFLSNHKIPLPPLSEQKQIAALFQSIDAAIEKVEAQEGRLKGLWKRLTDDFVSDQPVFGNLLNGKSLQTVTYSEVAQKIMRRIDPIDYGIEKIVAGENMESEDFKIRTWQRVGEGYLGPAFHVLFTAGDILYGSRRTYLRKVALANFEGVCSNTTYVIRAKENLLLQDLLKHVMLSEKFTQYSIGVSKGSTNPYINWSDLDNFTFNLPDIETQKEIVRILDGIWDIIEQLKTQKSRLKQLKRELLNKILG